ncbi:MAG TPA: hypothetical protein VKK31_29680 [Thermoanaerobaculia bacterium]|nr:hypothetical protein [Thermoanaerobaculia bacterium]
MLRGIRVVLAGVTVLLMAGMSWAAPRRSQEEGKPLANVWTLNLGGDFIELQVERTGHGARQTETILLAPGQISQVRRSAGEEVRIQDHPDLLLVTASAGFDPASLGIVRAASGEAESLGDVLPDTAALFAHAKARAESRLRRGESAVSKVLWNGNGPLAARVTLRSGSSSAEVRALDSDGAVLGYVTLSASREVEVKVDLRSFLQQRQYWGIVTQEIMVRKGEVSTLSREPGDGAGFRRFQEASVGTGQFSLHINHAYLNGGTPLYYYVTGGPASTCGELNSYRNNSWIFGPGWLCTNGSGSATKGPWYSAPTDQKDDPSFIRWPDNSTTTSDWHIWDKTCPTVSSSSPPLAWNGTATDGAFGTCFTSSSPVEAYYQDRTTGFYWTPTSGGFNQTRANAKVTCMISNVPSCNATWTCPTAPLPSGLFHQYMFTACTRDGGCGSCLDHVFYY